MQVSVPGLATRAVAHAARRAVPALLRGGQDAPRTGVLAAAAERLLTGPRRPPAREGPAALLPAALRVERSLVRRGDRSARHVALTVWFGEGPALPGPAWHGAARRATVVGAGMMGAALLAAAAARLGTARDAPRVVDAPSRPVVDAPSVPEPGKEPAAGARADGGVDGAEVLAIGAEHLA